MTYFRQDLAHFGNYKVDKIALHNLGDNENRLVDWRFLSKEVLEQLEVGDLSYYGDNKYANVIQAFANYAQVDANQVVQGVGSDHLLQTIITAFLGKEDTLLTVDPDFFMYGVFSQIHGTKLSSFPLDWSKGYPDFSAQDLLAYAKEIDAKLIMLSNPNNPSSVAFDNQELEKLIAGFSGIVVLDEAYIDFSDSPSFIHKTNEYENLIVLRTMSKAFGLAGLRLGFSISCPTLALDLDKALPPYSMPNIVAKLGEAALSHSDVMKKSVIEIKAIRQDFEEFLKSLPELTLLPSQTNFVAFTAPYAEDIYQAGLKNDFAFKYYPAGTLKNYIRMSIGRRDEMEKMKALIQEIVTK